MNILYHWLTLEDVQAFLTGSNKIGPLLNNISAHSELHFDKIVCLTNFSDRNIDSFKNQLIKILRKKEHRKIIYNIKKVEYQSTGDLFYLYKKFLVDQTSSDVEIVTTKHFFGWSPYLSTINNKIRNEGKHNFYILKNDFRNGKSQIWRDPSQKNLYLMLNPDKIPTKSQFESNYFDIKYEILSTFLNSIKESLKTEDLPKSFEDIITYDESLRNLINILSFIAKTDFSILLTGETGTGKELFAKAIHSGSDVLNKKRFIALNCAVVSESLYESEMFGIEDKTATNVKGKPGIFEMANGGTLFLDEIGDMPISAQTTLLRVLQEKEVMRLGGKEVKKVNFRLICATNRNIKEMISKREFRDDLYYRINDYEVDIPPLAKRNKLDVLSILNKQLKDMKNKYPEYSFVNLSDDAKEWILSYSWPGNVRQLIKHIKIAFMIAAFNSDDINIETLKFSGLIKPNDILLIDKQEQTDNESVGESKKSNSEINPYKELYKVNIFKDFKIKEMFKNIEKDYLTDMLKKEIKQKDIAKMLGLRNQQDISYRKKKYNIQI